MRKLAFTVFLAMVVLAPISGHCRTPFQFSTTNGHFITQMGDEHYLVAEDFQIDEERYWAVWQLNKTSLAWELVVGERPVPGSKLATGRYHYDPAKNLLILNTIFSVFLGCSPGPSAGTDVFHANLNDESLELTIIELDEILEEDDVMTLNLTRTSGTPGQIQGQWNLVLGTNSLDFTLNEDSTFSINGDLQECVMD